MLTPLSTVQYPGAACRLAVDTHRNGHAFSVEGAGSYRSHTVALNVVEGTDGMSLGKRCAARGTAIQPGIRP